jgi:YHS domain-containing protein
MRGLLSLLVYAGLFYLMMRFGCGAHMVHGHGGEGGHRGQGGSAKDPVCGMSVGPGQGYIRNYEGRALHFCSRRCLDKFEAEPQHYVS